VKTPLIFLCLLSTLTRLFAGEGGLLQTFQPLEGFEAGEPIIAPVTCYAHNTHTGWYPPIRYISIRYVPVSLGDTSVGDINLASLSGVSVWADESEGGPTTITLDLTRLKPTHGYTERQIVAATLECLRRVAGEKLASTPIEAKYLSSGQDEIKELVAAFLKHPKDKEFRAP
jgi:hypothetical protein